jgi:long-subunit fatty acid transport protein
MNGLRKLALATALTVVAPASALAQNTEDQNVFDFSLPGARSRGIGGAFVAIADDATSVYSNPAGLTLLFRPEVSIEGRRWNFTNTQPSRGHAFGPATGRGIDRVEGLQDDEFESSTTGVSFASFVYPGRQWAAGVFYHQLSQYRMDREIKGPLFHCSGGFRVGDTEAYEPFCEPHAIDDGVDREFPKRQSMSLDIHSVGGAFAVDLPARVSLGVAVQYFSFSLSSENTVFNARDALKYQSANFAASNVELVSRQFGTDHALAFNAGVLWDISDRFVAGFSFRQGPEFEFSTETTRGAASAVPGQKVVGGDENPFHVPDTFSVGVLYRPTDVWRVSFEYDRVQYHQLIEDFRNTAFFPGNPEHEVVSARMRLNDSNQLRVGGEYLALLPASGVLAFRAGVWHDPSHQTYFDSDPATGLPAPRWAVLFPRRDGSVHFTGGVGFTTRRHFQLDFAVDFSDVVDTYALSTVVRF